MGKLIIKSNYATIPNGVLKDTRISLKAKGLFALIQSKPDGWNFSRERLANETKEGMTAIKSAMTELKEIGYLKTKPHRTKTGTFVGYDYILDDFPSGGKTVGAVSRPSDNHTAFSKKDYSNKELSNKENTCESNDSREIAQVIQIFKEVSPALSYGNKTQRKACEEMIKLYGIKKVLEMSRVVLEIQGERFAPRATTPYAMWTKLGDFKAFFAEKNKPTLKVEGYDEYINGN